MSLSRLLTTCIVLLVLSACASSPAVKVGEGVPSAASEEADGLSPAEYAEYQQAQQALQSGKLQQAERALKKLTVKQPTFAEAWGNLALVYYQRQALEDAGQAAAKANEHAPGSAQIANLLGLIATDQGEFEQAEAHYKAAITRNPSYANAHYNLALLYDIYYQEIAQAVTHYRRYLELVDYSDETTVNWLEQLEYSLDANE